MSDQTYSAELRLVYEVLRRAIWDALKITDDNPKMYITEAQHMAHKAVAWIGAKDMHPFSCRWCCEHLGITQNKVLKVLRDLKGENVKIMTSRKRHYDVDLRSVLDDGIASSILLGKKF